MTEKLQQALKECLEAVNVDGREILSTELLAVRALAPESVSALVDNGDYDGEEGSVLRVDYRFNFVELGSDVPDSWVESVIVTREIVISGAWMTGYHFLAITGEVDPPDLVELNISN